MNAFDEDAPRSSREQIIRAHCPKCGPERRCYVRGKHTIPGSDGPISWSDTAMILECAGCSELFFRSDYWFSEWDSPDYDAYGQEIMVPGVKETYWPAPTSRPQPQWLDKIVTADPTLGNLLKEMYAALDSGLSVLPAVAARTAFDRSSELLGVPEELPFSRKLDQLVSLGKIGADFRKGNVVGVARRRPARRALRSRTGHGNKRHTQENPFFIHAFRNLEKRH